MKVIGLEDGGVTVIFTDHPAHHRIYGKVEVSFSANTIRKMRRRAKKAAAKFQADWDRQQQEDSLLETPNTHAIDIHPESPADYPRLPARVHQGAVMLDPFSYATLIARLTTEWEDISEANDHDVVYCLDRAAAFMKATTMDDGWVAIGYEQPEGGVVRIAGLTGVRAGSGASYQHVEYPITKLDRPRPFGAAFNDPVPSL